MPDICTTDGTCNLPDNQYHDELVMDRERPKKRSRNNSHFNLSFLIDENLIQQLELFDEMKGYMKHQKEQGVGGKNEDGEYPIKCPAMKNEAGWFKFCFGLERKNAKEEMKKEVVHLVDMMKEEAQASSSSGAEYEDQIFPKVSFILQLDEVICLKILNHFKTWLNESLSILSNHLNGTLDDEKNVGDDDVRSFVGECDHVSDILCWMVGVLSNIGDGLNYEKGSLLSSIFHTIHQFLFDYFIIINTSSTNNNGDVRLLEESCLKGLKWLWGVSGLKYSQCGDEELIDSYLTIKSQSSSSTSKIDHENNFHQSYNEEEDEEEE